MFWTVSFWDACNDSKWQILSVISWCCNSSEVVRVCTLTLSKRFYRENFESIERKQSFDRKYNLQVCNILWWWRQFSSCLYSNMNRGSAFFCFSRDDCENTWKIKDLLYRLLSLFGSDEEYNNLVNDRSGFKKRHNVLQHRWIFFTPNCNGESCMRYINDVKLSSKPEVDTRDTCLEAKLLRKWGSIEIGYDVQMVYEE
jgi:hypothetical protein